MAMESELWTYQKIEKLSLYKEQASALKAHQYEVQIVPPP